MPQQKVVLKVLAHVAVDASGLAMQRDSLREQLKSQKAQDREKLFETGLVDSLTRAGKIKLHKDVITKLESSYRG
jgi:hypothetical protein